MCSLTSGGGHGAGPEAGLWRQRVELGKHSPGHRAALTGTLGAGAELQGPEVGPGSLACRRAHRWPLQGSQPEHPPYSSFEGP